MALILCLETATRVCSVSLSHDGSLLGTRESDEPNIHSSMLTPFIDDLMKQTGHTFQDLDAVCVSMGPGSYTGLRIGVAVAKGLCYALDKPLLAVSTLQAMAEGMNYELKIKNSENTPPPSSIQYPASSIQHPTSSILLSPMIDARRMEVFCGLWDSEGKEIREVRAEIIDERSFREFTGAEYTILLGGDGAEKCKAVLSDHPQIAFLDHFEASSRYLTRMATEKYNAGAFENLAYFEPFYLKDFIAGKPRVKGLT